jgi:hypothetical protein
MFEKSSLPSLPDYTIPYNSILHTHHLENIKLHHTPLLMLPVSKIKLKM